MLLIDASNVAGGGSVLLQYLVGKLDDRSLPFFLLKRKEAMLDGADGRAANVDGRLSKRRVMLQAYCNQIQPSTLLCFGNFPPPFRSSIRTITYFHNQHILKEHDRAYLPLKSQLVDYARRLYLKQLLSNTDAFVVQTPLVRDGFINTFSVSPEKVAILPFYNREKISQIKDECVRDATVKLPATFLYASSSEPHKNTFNLLRAWEILARQGHYPALQITVPYSSPFTTTKLRRYIAQLQAQNVAIDNLENVPYETLLKRTYQSSYCIFPSLNETLGLGLVEAQLMGNPIAVSKRPFAEYVIEPSVSFDPYDADDIALKVQQLLSEETPPSRLLIENKIDELIHFIYQ